MSVYVLTYELSRREEEYVGLMAAITSNYDWCHYIDDTWFISTDESTDEIFKRLAPFFRDNDIFLITEVKDKRIGRLPQRAWSWFRDKFEIKRDYGDNEDPLTREELDVLPNMSIK